MIIWVYHDLITQNDSEYDKLKVAYLYIMLSHQIFLTWANIIINQFQNIFSKSWAFDQLLILYSYVLLDFC